MKRKATLGVLVALAATAPAVVAPKLVAPAHAQDRAEYPDVPRGHWAYEALDRLSKAGVIEGLPNGTYAGNKSMTRYEFAVAIARLLDKINAGGGAGVAGAMGPAGPVGPQGPPGPLLPDLVRRPELNDAINALQREFADELAKMGVKVQNLDDRVTAIEARLNAPPKFTVTPKLLYREGTANYINDAGGFASRQIANVANNTAPLPAPGAGGAGTGFNGAAGALGTANPVPPAPVSGYLVDGSNQKFTYTDFELAMTDRVSDTIMAHATLDALSDNSEDPWAGNTATNGEGIIVREAYAVADLSSHDEYGVHGLTAIIGRQHTKIAQGLLYDNDLSPTEQAQLQLRVGPVHLSGFSGNSGDSTFAGFGNPYLTQGSAEYIGNSNVNPVGVGGGLVAGQANAAGTNGSFVGFPSGGGAAAITQDNESAVHGSLDLFKIAGEPVNVGLSHLFSGVGGQKGDSGDISATIWQRKINFEYVRESEYFNGSSTSGNPHAYNVTVPALHTKIIDLNLAYGQASDQFEYFVASSVNPYERSYGEAVFDRPLALGSPMINGAGAAGQASYMAAKKAFDVSGQLRLPVFFLKHIPLDYRYYDAHGTGGIYLGKVYTVGATFPITHALDLNLKYGNYNVPGPTRSIQYLSAGASIGF